MKRILAGSARQRSPLESFGGSVLGRLRSSVGARAWHRRRRCGALPGVAGAAGSESGPTRAQAARRARWAARPGSPAERPRRRRSVGRHRRRLDRPAVLVVSTAGPPHWLAALAAVELLLRLVELGLRLLGHLLRLVHEAHVDSSPPPAIDSTRPAPLLQGVGEAPRHLRVLPSLPQRHDQQLAARAVPQAHEGDRRRRARRPSPRCAAAPGGGSSRHAPRRPTPPTPARDLGPRSSDPRTRWR